MPGIRARCASMAGRSAMLAPGCAGGRHRHGASGAFRRARAVGGGERPSRHAAGQSARTDRLAGDAPRRGRASAKSRHRRRSAHPDGRVAARTSAACGAGARAVLRRADHHPGRADLRALAARGPAAVRAVATAARGRAQHRVHLAFSRRRAGDLRAPHGIPQRPDGRDRTLRGRRQALGHRPHDRRGTRRTGGELPRRTSRCTVGRMRRSSWSWTD